MFDHSTNGLSQTGSLLVSLGLLYFSALQLWAIPYLCLAALGHPFLMLGYILLCIYYSYISHIGCKDLPTLSTLPQHITHLVGNSLVICSHSNSDLTTVYYFS